MRWCATSARTTGGCGCGLCLQRLGENCCQDGIHLRKYWRVRIESFSDFVCGRIRRKVWGVSCCGVSVMCMYTDASEIIGFLYRLCKKVQRYGWYI
jgi:hypothetical protein